MIEGDPSGTFQRWADEAQMPLPPIVKIRAGSPGECGNEFESDDSANPACVYFPDSILITKPRWINRWTFYHELGHIFDAEEMTDPERGQFLTSIGFPERAWDYSEPGVDIHQTEPREFFANAYAECATTGSAPKPRVLSRILPVDFGPVWIEDPVQWRRICRQIAAAAVDS